MKAEEPALQVLSSPYLLRHITSFQRGRKIKEWTSGDLAASLGYLSILEQYHTHLLVQADDRADSNSSSSGRWTMFFSCLAVDQAASNGHLDVVKWLHQHRKEGGTLHGFIDAAKNGHLKVVKYLLDRTDYKKGLLNDPNVSYFTDAMDGAAANGHLDVLAYLHRQSVGACSVEALDRAAENGHFEIVQWLQTHRAEGCSSRAVDLAASMGHLQICQFIYQHYKDSRSFSLSRALEGAVSGAHVPVIEWLLSIYPQGFSLSIPILRLAIEKGNVQVVQLLQRHYPHPWLSSEEAISLGTSTGRLDILDALNISPDKLQVLSTMPRIEAASSRGNTAMLRRLLSNLTLHGPLHVKQNPDFKRAFSLAVGNGHVQEAEYLLPWLQPPQLREISFLALIAKVITEDFVARKTSGAFGTGVENSMALLSLLHRANPQQFLDAAREVIFVPHVDVRIVKWLHEEFEPTKEGQLWATGGNKEGHHYCTGFQRRSPAQSCAIGSLDLYIYLNRTRICSFAVNSACVASQAHAAVQKGNLQMLQWLLDTKMLVTFEDDTVNEAATFGHTHVLQWLLSLDPSQCPGFSWRVIVHASSLGRTEILRILTKNYPRRCVNPEGNVFGSLALNAAVQCRQWEVVPLLAQQALEHEHRRPSAEIVAMTAARGNLVLAAQLDRLRSDEGRNPCWFDAKAYSVFFDVLFSKSEEEDSSKKNYLACLEWVRRNQDWRVALQPESEETQALGQFHSLPQLAAKACKGLFSSTKALGSYEVAQWMIKYYPAVSEHAMEWLSYLVTSPESKLETLQLVWNSFLDEEYWLEDKPLDRSLRTFAKSGLAIESIRSARETLEQLGIKLKIQAPIHTKSDTLKYICGRLLPPIC